MIVSIIALFSIITNGLLVIYILNNKGNSDYINLKKERDELFSQKSKLEGINEVKEKQIAELSNKNSQLNEVFKNNKVLEEQNTKLLKDLDDRKDYYEIKEQNKVLQEQLQQQEKYINKLKDEMTSNFKNISHSIIEEQGENFKKTQRDVFVHFQNEVKNFISKVEENTKTNNNNKTSLEEQIKLLMNNNNNLAKEANDLTDALRGNKKIQGNWGEIQLERIIEMVGLKEGIDYIKQGRFTENDKVYIPDYIINLPNDRKIIVDSKVSLNSYIEYVKSESKEDREKYLKMYINDIKQHINELSNKEYQNLIKENSLDYVFMFLPLERAYIDAIDNDNSIYELAFKKHVAIATPSSIFPIIRTIQNLWNVERQNKNVEDIVDTGRRIYEQVSAFTSDIEKIKKGIDNLNEVYIDAYKRLYTGNENVVRLTEKLKKYGISIPEKKEIKYVDELLISNGEEQ